MDITIEQNTITRSWEVDYKGKSYFVDFTYSDGQTLALCNRGYWEIIDEEGNDATVAFKGQEPILEEKEMNKIVDFCIKNFLTGEFKNDTDKVMANR